MNGLLLLLLLLNVTSIAPAMAGCNVTECSDREGQCVLIRCETGGCGECASGEVCLDDNCVIESDNCDTVIDDITNLCETRGVPCGDGFCLGGRTCVNDTCRAIFDCGVEANIIACSAYGGSCSDGACLLPCDDDSGCLGYQCIDGSCAGVKCGESVCLL